MKNVRAIDQNHNCRLIIVWSSNGIDIGDERIVFTFIYIISDRKIFFLVMFFENIFIPLIIIHIAQRKDICMKTFQGIDIFVIHNDVTIVKKKVIIKYKLV